LPIGILFLKFNPAGRHLFGSLNRQGKSANRYLQAYDNTTTIKLLPEIEVKKDKA